MINELNWIHLICCWSIEYWWMERRGNSRVTDFLPGTQYSQLSRGWFNSCSLYIHPIDFLFSFHSLFWGYPVILWWTDRFQSPETLCPHSIWNMEWIPSELFSHRTARSTHCTSVDGTTSVEKRLERRFGCIAHTRDNSLIRERVHWYQSSCCHSEVREHRSHCCSFEVRTLLVDPWFPYYWILIQQIDCCLYLPPSLLLPFASW